MDWGLKNRLSQIISPKTGRAVMLAVDHGYFLGPTSGLETPRSMLEPLIPYADSLMLTRGILRNCVSPEARVPIVLRVSGGTSILTPLSNEEITVSIQDAIRLNASALAVSIFVGSEHEKQTLTNLTKTIDQANEYGLAVLAVTAVGKDMARDARYLSLACRIAAELGAHLVKTYYCSPEFERITETCPVPIIIAGGKKTEELEALVMCEQAVNGGAVGVDMGRNIFQSENPTAMIQAVRKVVHENISAKQAYEFFKKAPLANGKSSKTKKHSKTGAKDFD